MPNTTFINGCKVKCIENTRFTDGRFAKATVGNFYIVEEIEYLRGEKIGGLTLRDLGRGFSPSRFEVEENTVNFFD